MKKFFLIVLTIAGFAAWNFRQLPKVAAPCAQPITYAIGFFDRKFGVSYENFLKALNEAEGIWERPIHKELFSYSPQQPDLAVNLIYDYRQETTNTLSNISEKVEENEGTYYTLYGQFKKLKAEYDADEKIYNNIVAAFSAKNSEYDQMVALWNASSRTSKKQFEELETKKVELQNDLEKLKAFEARLNEKGRRVNVYVNELNHLANILNLDVEKFNTIGATRGETFTGGSYAINGEEKSIDIFEFKNKEKLVRVLAHELGHALGLEHMNDPQAIMYKLNKSDAGMAVASDVTALKKLCGMI
ncbi:MAG: matrixin family metalloprotease [Candidatus Zambryskibacteria bacterium]|nr:matrixin family metalloprotease [Candidatus Zambryskibacteria bacterium]